jgi:hypothetical protein
VLIVGSAFGEEILSGEWRFVSDASRVAELLDLPLQDVVSVPLAEVGDDGQWHLPGRHALYLARKLCERYPTLIHDYAAVTLDRQLASWDSGPNGLEFYRGAYLLICSWCHIAPDCDYLESLQRQRKEIEWLYGALQDALGRLSHPSPQGRYVVLQRVRDHYHLGHSDEMPSGWPGLPPSGC